MLWQVHGEIKWLESKLLRDLGVPHGWFSRSGGVSRQPFESLNVKKGFADPDDNVDQNRQRALQALGLDSRQLVFIKHQHSAKVLVADASMAIDDQLADAVIANDSQFVLGQGTADCNSVIVADTKHLVAALIHASWRSLKAGIVDQTIKQISTVVPKRGKLVAAIGPSVCGRCYEFGPEAEDLFLPQYVAKNNGRHHVDLKAWVGDELTVAGVSEVDDLGVCTMENKHYFSHRRDQDENSQSGRFLTLAGL